MSEIKKLHGEERRHGLHHMKDQQKRIIAPNPQRLLLSHQFLLQLPYL